MSQTLKRKTSLKIFTVCLVVICVLSTLFMSDVATASAQESIASVALRIHQSFIRNGEAVQLDREITYQIRPLEVNNPMPVGTASGVFTFRISETATMVEIPRIAFYSAGIFRYEVAVTSSGLVGLTTDSRTFVIEIIVASDGRLAYNVFVNGEKTDRVIFEHIIEMVTISGRKTWNHGVLPARYHPEHITVLVMDGNNVVVRERITRTEQWRWSFVLPRFDGNREIAYTVSEEPTVGYTMRVDGHNITNTFNPNDPQIPPSWNIPKTGDDSNMILWISLMIGSGALLAVVILVYRKSQNVKKRENEF